jgi:hypothetical protein
MKAIAPYVQYHRRWVSFAGVGVAVQWDAAALAVAVVF